MALPAIPNELLADIFLRLSTSEDLIRASAACFSFRRLVADRAFLRRFRKLHPPPLLGFFDYRGFHPAEPPHPYAPAASAVADDDLNFGFLPGSSLDWTMREVRDGRVLLDRPGRHEPLFKETVVCDPLHQQYLLLPPIPVPHHADHRGVDCRHQNHEKLTSPGNCRASAVVAAAARAPEPVEAGKG
uniref:Uncharacterized protein n=1 Tax=Aegilops tauschii TaxID=37682 RepID=M8BDG2_AEGTA